MSYLSNRFTYPFCYVPRPEIIEAAKQLIAKINARAELSSIFAEGKMMGVLQAEDASGNTIYLYAFSGLAGGKSSVDGFVPPIFDTTSIPELRGVLSAEESAALQDRLFQEYRVHNALGEELSIKEIFALRGIVPPGGTGDCAGPKLLEHAYRNSLKPIAMGEFWYGQSHRSEVRLEGCFYPSCTGKCGPLLTWMTKGLMMEPNPLHIQVPEDKIRILYEDDTIIVASKPSGMLCAPGLNGSKSLQEILEQTKGKLFSCHRLDMDTSGVIVYAKNVEAQADIMQQFEHRQTSKTYLAHLSSGLREFKGRKKGTIALPLAPDWYDRPRQIVDRENGKQAITEYEVLKVFPDGEMDVRFIPKTGRTHQLRVHAAHSEGLGHPIKGDRLYGCPDGDRLMLHAESLTLRHPLTGEVRTFVDTL